MAKRALSWKRAGAIAWRDLKSAPGKFGFVVLSVAVGVAAPVRALHPELQGFLAADGAALDECFVIVRQAPLVHIGQRVRLGRFDGGHRGRRHQQQRNETEEHGTCHARISCRPCRAASAFIFATL